MTVNVNFAPVVAADTYTETQLWARRREEEHAHRFWVETAVRAIAQELNTHLEKHNSFEAQLIALVQAVSDDVKANPQAARMMPRTFETVAALVMDRIEGKDK